MTNERREKILNSLREGNSIRRHWKGANLSGYLSHNLEGVKRLRENEVEELKKEGLLEIDKSKLYFTSFKSYILKVAGNK